MRRGFVNMRRCSMTVVYKKKIKRIPFWLEPQWQIIVCTWSVSWCHVFGLSKFHHQQLENEKKKKLIRNKTISYSQARQNGHQFKVTIFKTPNLFFIIYNKLAYRPATRTFQLTLQGYLVASLTRASHFALGPRLFRSGAFCAHEIFWKQEGNAQMSHKKLW